MGFKSEKISFQSGSNIGSPTSGKMIFIDFHRAFPKAFSGKKVEYIVAEGDPVESKNPISDQEQRPHKNG
jgi:hypothetical protein